MSNIVAYRKMVDRGFPGPVMKYFYITEYEGHPWVADIEDEAAEGWVDEFVWDDEPCGRGIRESEIAAYLKDADEIGYIDDNHALHITTQWRVPTAYSYGPGMQPMVSGWDWVGKDSNPGNKEE